MESMQILSGEIHKALITSGYLFAICKAFLTVDNNGEKIININNLQPITFFYPF